MVETDLLLVYNSISGQDLRNSKYSNLINECVRLLRCGWNGKTKHIYRGEEIKLLISWLMPL